MMLDFKELGQDGKDFELFTREILNALGGRAYWSGVGPDGGRDLLCIESKTGFIGKENKTWLVQCKHFAHSGKSVGIKDLDDIVTSCAQHNAQAYLLVCSTHPSSAVVERLEQVSKNTGLLTDVWDSVQLERLVATPKLWNIAQRFMPISSNSKGWSVYATEKPNHWVANYDGFYFHLYNRIGSRHLSRFNSVEDVVYRMKSIKLDKNHFLRLRSVYYDDKCGSYTYYIDYMYPSKSQLCISSSEIKHLLGDETIFDDGQFYFFDVYLIPYIEDSDHYDEDHYDYYERHIMSYASGGKRYKNFKELEEEDLSGEILRKKFEKERIESFEKLTNKINSFDFVTILRAKNSDIEYIDRFYALNDWSRVIDEYDIDGKRFFSAWLYLRVTDTDMFYKMISFFPQQIDGNFRLTRPVLFFPTEKQRSQVGKEEGNIFDLTLSINPHCINNRFDARHALNSYFDLILDGLNAFSQQIGNH